jgi:hypothetical protein
MSVAGLVVRLGAPRSDGTYGTDETNEGDP